MDLLFWKCMHVPLVSRHDVNICREAYWFCWEYKDCKVHLNICPGDASKMLQEWKVVQIRQTESFRSSKISV